MILFNFMDLMLALQVELTQLLNVKVTNGGDDNDEDDREDNLLLPDTLLSVF